MKEDATYRLKKADTYSKSAFKRWEDPEYRKKQIEERQERGKDPEYRKKMSKSCQKNAKNSKWRKKISVSKKKWFKKNPEELEKHRQMIKDTNTQRKQKMQENWENPAFIYKMMEARVGHDRALELIEEKLGRREMKKFYKTLNHRGKRRNFKEENL